LLELLVLRCKRGDRAAFDEMVRQWEGRLFYYVRRLVAAEEDAWDVLQQTWINVFRDIKSLFPMSGRIGFAAGALFGIGWAILAIKIFRRGSLDLKKDTWAGTGLMWVFVVFMATWCMVTAPNTIVGLRMLICSLVFLVMGVGFLLRYVIEQSELKTREKLLEIECRLAELAALGKPETREP
jgi:hypothetical protein